MTNETLTQRIERDNLPREGIVGKGIAYEVGGTLRVRFGQTGVALANTEEKARGFLFSDSYERQDSTVCNYGSMAVEEIAKRYRGRVSDDISHIERVAQARCNSACRDVMSDCTLSHTDIATGIPEKSMRGGFWYISVANKLKPFAKSEVFGPVENLQEVVRKALEGSGLEVI